MLRIHWYKPVAFLWSEQLSNDMLVAQTSVNCDYEDALPFRMRSVKNSNLLQLNEVQHVRALD